MEPVYEPGKEEREELSEPLGKVLKEKDVIEEFVRSKLEGKLILVGDYVSLKFEDLNPDLSIVDGRIGREEVSPGKLEGISSDLELRAENERGKISSEAWNKVKEGIVRDVKIKLMVDGEEDLLGIPSIELAPSGSVVIYGQRDMGSVLMSVDEQLKRGIRSFVDRRCFEKVIVGGSWRFLHPGHRYLLLTAFERGKKVSIGVTSDEMIEEKVEEEYRAYGERVEEVKEFLRNYNLMERAEIQKIQDFKGHAVEEGDAIVVSEETWENAKRINDIRRREGREALKIIEIPMLKDHNGDIISSSDLRRE